MLKSAARFSLVGVVNTFAGLVIISLLVRAGLGDFGANALGYGVCIALSFALNRSFTFGVSGSIRWCEVRRYLAVFSLAYGTNVIVLVLMRELGFAGSIVAQITAMIAYSATFFLLSHRYVFATERYAR